MAGLHTQQKAARRRAPIELASVEKGPAIPSAAIRDCRCCRYGRQPLGRTRSPNRWVANGSIAAIGDPEATPFSRNWAPDIAVQRVRQQPFGIAW